MFINMRLKHICRVLKLSRPLPSGSYWHRLFNVSVIYRDLTTDASSMAEVTGGPVTVDETTDTELGINVTNKEDVAQVDLAGQPTTPDMIDVLGKTYVNQEEDVCYVNQD